MAAILIILGVVLQAAFITVEHRGRYAKAVTLKGMAAFCFVLLGILCASGDGFSRQIIAGLAFGMAGDILLGLRYVFPKAGHQIFLVGTLAFLVGHICYLSALVNEEEDPIPPAVIGLILSALLILWLFGRIRVSAVQRILGVFYLVAVSLMAVYAVWDAVRAPDAQTILFGIGGVLFLISDVILIMNTFTGRRRFSLRIANLGLYYMGQILIALSLAAA